MKKLRRPEKLTTLDVADDLRTDKSIAIFLAEAEKTGDAGFVAHAQEVVERAKAKIYARKSKPRK